MLQTEGIEASIRTLLGQVGEDPERPGLRQTPKRVAQMYAELLSGYQTDPVMLLNGAIFEEDYDEMVIVRDIEFASLCEHHLLPFIGRAHVAYMPKGKIVGLSKVPRIVDMYARRLQVQERMTREIADFLSHIVEPQGVAVVIEALHLCASIRGVKKAEARMQTSAMQGVFRHDPRTRSEFLAHIARPVAREF